MKLFPPDGTLQRAKERRNDCAYGGTIATTEQLTLSARRDSS